MPKTQREFDLVFEGGGAKGAVFVGALEEFFGRGLKPRRLIGTSAGSISAVLLAAGYTPEEMQALAEEKTPEGQPRFTTFMDLSSPEIYSSADINESLIQKSLELAELPTLLGAMRGVLVQMLVLRLLRVKLFGLLFSVVERGGVFAGERFRQWIQEKLNAKQPGLGAKTLGGFQEATGVDLSLVGCDTMGRERMVLNHRTAPECPIDWAVRMSMSIPFVWQEVTWRSEWGNYLGRTLTGHSIVDGGVLSNFPLDLIVGSDDSVRAIMGPTDSNAAGILGLLVDENLEVPGSAQGTEGEDGATIKSELGDAAKNKTVGRLMRLFNTVLEGRDKQYISSYQKYVCRLPAKGYGTTEFGMSPERMTALIDAGRTAMKSHLDGQMGSRRPVTARPGRSRRGGVRG